jgi:lactate permease
MISASKKGLFMPKTVWYFQAPSSWPMSWVGTLKIEEEQAPKNKISPFSAWMPYAIVSILLVCSRVFVDFKSALVNIGFS